MIRLFNKTGTFTILLICVIFITACSKDKADEKMVVEDTTEENEHTTSSIEKSSTEDEITSEFVRSQTSISSFFIEVVQMSAPSFQKRLKKR